jgi:hypothetical protein
LLLLLPSAAWAQVNPHDGAMRSCFLHQLATGDWPNGLVSWSRMIVNCQDVVNNDIQYCIANDPDPGSCVTGILMVASLSIMGATDRDTHRFDPKMGFLLGSH